jgi:hypothetical protein
MLVKRAASTPATVPYLRADDNSCKPPRPLADPASSFRRRAPLHSETALPEANSFPCGCQQFCCIPIGFPRVIRGSSVVCCGYRAAAAPAGTKVSRLFRFGPLAQTKFDPEKPAQYPQTVARKSAIRLRPGSRVRGPRRPAARPTSDRPADERSREGWWADGSTG